MINSTEAVAILEVLGSEQFATKFWQCREDREISFLTQSPEIQRLSEYLRNASSAGSHVEERLEIYLHDIRGGEPFEHTPCVAAILYAAAMADLSAASPIIYSIANSTIAEIHRLRQVAKRLMTMDWNNGCSWRVCSSMPTESRHEEGEEDERDDIFDHGPPDVEIPTGWSWEYEEGAWQVRGPGNILVGYDADGFLEALDPEGNRVVVPELILETVVLANPDLDDSWWEDEEE